jgi:hypothetical protein
MKHVFWCLLLFLFASTGEAQRIIIIVGYNPTVPIGPEHGFLGGKKFKIYPAVGKYDLHGIRLRIELHDVRDSLKQTKPDCFSVEMTNTSELEGPYGAHVVADYFDSLFTAANIQLDSAATDVLKVNLEALDARLIGFGNITAHGLCKMTVQWKTYTHSYCVDITDKDPHSPISSHAFVTRKTATRVIASAAIREAVEKAMTDLEFDK